MAKNKANKQNVVSRVREAILSTVTQMGYLLWDVELVKEGSELDLVVSIDSPRGIGLEDCEAVTHAINPILDALDPIEENYYLEVSSVGVERTLKTPEQFAFCRSWPVTVGFYAPLPESFGPLAGVKLLEGTLALHLRVLLYKYSIHRFYSLSLHMQLLHKSNLYPDFYVLLPKFSSY